MSSIVKIEPNNVALFPASDGWAAVPPASRAKRIKFSDGEWTNAEGQRVNGEELAAVGVEVYWQKWADKKPIEKRATRPGEAHPYRSELGDEDQSTWEIGPNGQPSDPWQDVREVRLVDRETGEEFAYGTSTWGGHTAVAELAKQIENVRRAHPRATPIVRLESERTKTKYGVKPWPKLKVVSWIGRDAEAAPAQNLAATLDDDLPW